MASLLKTLNRLAAAGLIVGQVAATDPVFAQDLPTPPTTEATGKPAVTENADVIRARSEIVYDRALDVGRYLQTIHNIPDQREVPRLRRELRGVVQQLQQSLLDYRAARPNHYLPSIAVDGRLGRDTATLFVEVAALEGLKEIFIDRPEVQDPENAVAFRFLRNELTRLAPQSYIIALATIAGDTEHDLQAEKIEGFIFCVASHSQRRHSERYIAEETQRINANPTYITPSFQQCATYLQYLRTATAQRLQVETLNTMRIQPSWPGSSTDWCERDEPKTFGIGRRCIEMRI